MSANLETPRRALAIGAHPDDIEFGCGGTLAKWAAAGCEVAHLVCTDGGKGSWDPSTDSALLVATRQVEQRRAAAALGCSGPVEFLGWPDGELESGVRQRIQVSAMIRRFRPDVVLGHDPWKRYRLHPDHRHAGFLTTDSVVAARDALFFPELAHAAHRPEFVLLFEADEPDHLEEITATIETKIDALLEHRSQLRSTMLVDEPIDRSNPGPGLAEFIDRTRARHHGLGGLSQMEFAETFKLIDAS